MKPFIDWEGFKDGFVSTIEAARPVFRDLVDAFQVLGREFSALFGGATKGAAALPSNKFQAFGQVVGQSLGTVVKWAVKLFAIYLRIYGGVLGGFRSMLKYVRPALKSVSDALGTLGDAWDTLTGATKSSSASTKESTKAWRSLGLYLGKSLGVVLTTTAYSLAAMIRALAFSITVLGAFKDAFVAAGTWTASTARIIHHWFVVTLPAAIGSAIRRVVRFYRAVGMFFVGIERWFSKIFAAIGQGVKSFLQPVFRVIATIGRGIRRAIGKIMDFVIKLLRKIPDRLLPSRLEKIKRMPLSTEVKTKDDFVAVQNTQSAAGKASAASSAVPAATESSTRMRSFDRVEASLLALVKSQTHGKTNRQPIILKVQVDGETIAQASHEANEELASRTYSSVPAY